jgi:hypothetical protein
MSAIIAAALRHADICCRNAMISRIDTFDDRSSATAMASQTRPAPVDPSSQPYHSVDYPQPQEAPTDCSPGQAHRERPVPPRRCQRTVGPSEPGGLRATSPTRTHRGHHAGIDTTGSTLTSPTSTRSTRPTRASLVCSNQSS